MNRQHNTEEAGDCYPANKIVMSDRSAHRHEAVPSRLAFGLSDELRLTAESISRLDTEQIEDPLSLAQRFDELALALDQAATSMAVVRPVQDIFSVQLSESSITLASSESPLQLVRDILADLDPVSKSDPRVAVCLLAAARVSKADELEKIIEVLEDLTARRANPLAPGGVIDSAAFIESKNEQERLDTVRRFGARTPLKVMSEIIASHPSTEVQKEIVAAVTRGALISSNPVKDTLAFLKLLEGWKIANHEDVRTWAENSAAYLKAARPDYMDAQPKPASGIGLIKNGAIDMEAFRVSGSVSDRVAVVQRLGPSESVEKLAEIVALSDNNDLQKAVIASLEKGVMTGLIEGQQALKLLKVMHDGLIAPMPDVRNWAKTTYARLETHLASHEKSLPEPTEKSVSRDGAIDPVAFIESDNAAAKIVALEKFGHLSGFSRLAQISVTPQPENVQHSILRSVEKSFTVGTLKAEEVEGLLMLFSGTLVSCSTNITNIARAQYLAVASRLPEDRR